MDSEWAGTENLHGGPRMDLGSHQYQWHQGRMYSGLVGCMYALTDVNPGDGGVVRVGRAFRLSLPKSNSAAAHS